MSDQPKDKDGLPRMVARCRLEWRQHQRKVTMPFARYWISRPWDLHALQDVITESERVSQAAYLRSHFWTTLVTLLVLCNVTLLGLWRGWWVDICALLWA